MNLKASIFVKESPHLKSFYNQPIIKNFLKDEENQKVFMAAHERPTKNNLSVLNEKFKSFYYHAKIYKYLTSLIQIYSIDFDKRERRRKERVNLILDRPISDSDHSSASLVDVLKFEDHGVEDRIMQNNLASIVSDEKLLKILAKLTPKQNQVLTMIYIHGLTNKEVAQYFGDSPQNISSLHKQALNKIRKNYSKVK
ncbi:sigma-70 family RNA polymerase sigma factor [Niallia sp. Krafla_26]|uniref:sigma-70 family RNA polymerase sigma factor n=1 Tax=Niallia sp. Krafla_26 TaxID=3064703 RepID=UPI003D182A14